MNLFPFVQIIFTRTGFVKIIMELGFGIVK
jgi:hypothetical protein